VASDRNRIVTELTARLLDDLGEPSAAELTALRCEDVWSRPIEMHGRARRLVGHATGTRTRWSAAFGCVASRALRAIGARPGLRNPSERRNAVNSERARRLARERTVLGRLHTASPGSSLNSIDAGMT
jgi:hypothetical protein